MASVLLLASASAILSVSEWPWFNTSLPVAKRVASLVSAMNATELIWMLAKGSPPVARLGVPGYAWHMEGAHGVATGGLSTVFPCSLGRAAAWHPALERDVARAIAVEARAKWNIYQQLHNTTPYYRAEGLSLTLYAPEINLCRDPRWGRCQESRGEDPHLTAALVPPFVQGLQQRAGEGGALMTTAMLKDFVVYNLESSDPVGGHDSRYRLHYNAVVSPADLHQSFLPGFKAGVDAGARVVMTSYHALNGVPQTASPSVLQTLLRERLGFRGLVVSDGGAVGFILNFAYLNLSMTRNITAAAAAALNAGCDLNSGGYDRTLNPANCSVADMAGYAYCHLGDALAQNMVTIARLRQAATRALMPRFELGLFDRKNAYPGYGPTHLNSPAHRQLARQAAVEGMVLLRAGDVLPLNQTALRHVVVVGPNGNSSSSAESNYNGCVPADRFVNSADPSPHCTIATPFTGLRDALPHATVTFLPAVALAAPRKSDRADIARAASACAEADACVLVLGLRSRGRGVGKRSRDTDLEDEAHDRADLGLPPPQLALARAVLAQRPSAIVVLESGGVVTEPEIMAGPHAASTLIQMFYPGGEGGHALADLLLGKASFSGRLPVTVYPSNASLPPYFEQRMAAPPGRTHRYSRVPAMFPFGYGLTSAPILYSNLTVSPTAISATSLAPLNVSVEVRCPSSRLFPVQDEVVQVYVGLTQTPQGGAVDGPFRELGERSVPLHSLWAFRRVTVNCTGDGQWQRVHFSMPVSTLQLMDSDGVMRVLAGGYSVWAGGTSPRTKAQLTRGDGGGPTAPAKPLLTTFQVG